MERGCSKSLALREQSAIIECGEYDVDAADNDDDPLHADERDERLAEGNEDIEGREGRFKARSLATSKAEMILLRGSVRSMICGGGSEEDK